MFLALRIAAVVGAIFWMSPARQAEPTGSGDGDRIASLIHSLEAMPAEHRAAAIEGLAVMDANMPEMAAKMLRNGRTNGRDADPARHPERR